MLDYSDLTRMETRINSNIKHQITMAFNDHDHKDRMALGDHEHKDRMARIEKEHKDHRARIEKEHKERMARIEKETSVFKCIVAFCLGFMASIPVVLAVLK